ncbi:MAG: GreA/GreB family elongation factor [Planctomycetes bacterium]|nr:GreA/GreB family elongation factor [Planctomycetota bacterium]
MTHDLVHLARSEQLDSLESAWQQAVQSPRPDEAPRYGATIEALCEIDMASRALTLASNMVEALVSGRHLDAAIDLAQRVVRRGAHNEALARRLVDLLMERYRDEDWYPVLKERAGLKPEQITAQAILEFERLRRFTKGNVVYHQAGWGEGVIEGFVATTKELTVAFASGRREDFPLDTVLSRFKPLDHDDLRAMKLLQHAELVRLSEHEPAVLIRRVAKLYRGTVTSQQIKTELSPSVIAEKDWAAFWKRVKTAATKDSWLRVEGTPTRPTFVLRDRPVGIADEAAARLAHQNDLGQRVAVLREYFERGQDADVRGQILDLAVKTIEAALADKKASHAHILDGVLFLEEHGRKAPVAAAQELRALVLTPAGAFKPTAIDQLATQPSREHAVKLLPEALGPQWADLCLAALPDTPSSVMEHIVDQLIAQGHGERLLELWDKIAPYPRRFPVLTYLLGRAHADGVFDKRQDRAAAVAVGRVLLHLGRVLNAERKGNALFSRLMGRLTSLLSGKRGYMNLALKDISRDDLASYLGITERSGEDFPQEITDMILRCVADNYPELTAKAERPFWDKEENIYTTRKGLEAIKAEYRILVEDKIPTNSKAIGAAASLGDLSENSEWESAMEEQRNLTTRATAMDHEIRSAKLLEDQEIPVDAVAPGNRVRFVEVESGISRTFTVLGPWDVTNESVLNYRAPIATGILGKKVGETGEIPGPHGPLAVRIEHIERAL